VAPVSNSTTVLIALYNCEITLTQITHFVYSGTILHIHIKYYVNNKSELKIISYKRRFHSHLVNTLMIKIGSFFGIKPLINCKNIYRIDSAVILSLYIILCNVNWENHLRHLFCDSTGFTLPSLCNTMSCFQKSSSFSISFLKRLKYSSHYSKL
jgi:hypothetical protein